MRNCGKFEFICLFKGNVLIQRGIEKVSGELRYVEVLVLLRLRGGGCHFEAVASLNDPFGVLDLFVREDHIRVFLLKHRNITHVPGKI